MSIMSNLDRRDIIKVCQLIIPVFCLTLYSLTAHKAWRDDGGTNSGSSNSTAGESLKEKLDGDNRYLSSATSSTEAYDIMALSSAAYSNNNFRSDESIIYLGKTRNADARHRFDNEEKPVLDIGDPRDANGRSIGNAAEESLYLGELLDADNRSHSIIDYPSEAQNVGPDMVVGEDFDWQHNEPKNIGPALDAATHMR